MATQQSPLSKEALVQFNESTESGGLANQRRRASISTRRSSQTRDHQQFTSSVLGKRFSFGGWLPGGGRTSFSGLPLYQPPLQKLENTYRTEPEQQCRFKISQVQELIQTILESHLDGAQYNDSCSHLGVLLADMLRGKVKEITPPRYKLVCQVVIGQRKNQGVQVASCCLWDDHLDNFSVAEFQNHSLYALAIVHGVYFE